MVKERRRQRSGDEEEEKQIEMAIGESEMENVRGKCKEANVREGTAFRVCLINNSTVKRATERISRQYEVRPILITLCDIPKIV